MKQGNQGTNMTEEKEIKEQDPTLAKASIDELIKYEDHKDNRQLKNWVIKMFVFVIAMSFLVVCTGFVWVSSAHLIADSRVIKEFLETMTEIMKMFKA